MPSIIMGMGDRCLRRAFARDVCNTQQARDFLLLCHGRCASGVLGMVTVMSEACFHK